MIARLRLSALSLVNTVSSSFWFIPALISLGGIALAWLTISAEGSALIEDFAPRAAFTPDGARTILGTIAGAVMTVGGVVFSLTFVALSVVAQQLGPRIVTMLMRDRMTQITLGSFNATFLHALLTLTAISSNEEQMFIPSLALYAAVALAILSFALVIYFVHATARQLQADAVIAHLARDLDRAIEGLAIEDGGAPADLNSDEVEAAARLRDTALPVLSKASGYVQSIDYEAAARVACERDARAVFARVPGDFVLRGRPLLFCEEPADPEAERTAGECIAENCVRLGPQRTAVGNISFEINALVDVALRALSPSLNDPNTAVACMHHLADALARLAAHPLCSIVHADADGAPRVYEEPRTFADHAASVFMPLVPAAAGSPIAGAGLARVLDDLLAVTSTETQHASLEGWRDALESLRKAEHRAETDPFPSPQRGRLSSLSG